MLGRVTSEKTQATGPRFGLAYGKRLVAGERPFFPRNPGLDSSMKTQTH